MSENDSIKEQSKSIVQEYKDFYQEYKTPINIGLGVCGFIVLRSFRKDINGLVTASNEQLKAVRSLTEFANFTNQNIEELYVRFNDLAIAQSEMERVINAQAGDILDLMRAVKS